MNKMIAHHYVANSGIRRSNISTLCKEHFPVSVIAIGSCRTAVCAFVLRVFDVHLLPVRVANVNSSIVRNLECKEEVGPSRTRDIVDRVTQRLEAWRRGYTNCNHTGAATAVDCAVILVHV